MVDMSIIWIWIPLIAATVTAFIGNRRISELLLGVFLLCAVYEQRLSLFAMVMTVCGFGVAWKISTLDARVKRFLQWGIIVWVSVLYLHYLSGFYAYKVLDLVVSGAESQPFSMYLNIDKPLGAFTLFLLCPAMLVPRRRFNSVGVLFAVLLLILVLPLGCIFGLIHWEFSWPAWWWLFALNNLMITSVAEEALFRGFLFSELEKRFGWRIALVVSSVVFGLAHFSGDGYLAIVATLAGLGYGLTYYFSGRLWVAVLAHFLLNFSHLIFMTYPLAR